MLYQSMKSNPPISPHVKNELFYHYVSLIIEHYDSMPEPVKDSLVGMASHEFTSFIVVNVIFNYGKNLSQEVIEKLFKLILLSSETSRYTLANRLENDFDKLEPDIRNNLLIMLSDSTNHGIEDYVARIIMKNYAKLMPNIHNLLFKIVKSNEEHYPLDESIGDYIPKIPDDARKKLLLILLDKEKNSYGLIEGILQSYNDPPQDVKDFLIKMASNKKKSHIVASGIQQIPSMGGDFKKLPQDLLNRLLSILSDDLYVLGEVLIIIKYHYNELFPNSKYFFLKFISHFKPTYYFELIVIPKICPFFIIKPSAMQYRLQSDISHHF